MHRFPRPRAVPVLTLLALLAGASAQEVNEKAGRYYESLLKRPAPGAAFDRFYTAWLDTRTVEELEAWLKTQAEAPDAPVAARLLLAFFYARQNDPVKAITQFRLAVEKEPGNTGAWLHKARTEARTLDFDGALASLQKAVETNPPAEVLNEIRQLQGRWLARNGKTDEAVKIWQALMAARPDDEELREDLIELQITEGLHEQALATAKALLEKTADPYRRVQRRLRMADIQRSAGSRDAAIATYLQCLDDTGADSWMEKEVLARIEETYRKDDAIEALRNELAKLAAQHARRIYLRRQYARVLAESGDHAGAVREFKALLEITPGSRELREAFVELLMQARLAEEATVQMLELIRLNPADVELLVKLADLYFTRNLPDDCRRTVEEFVAKSDQSEASWLRAAGILERCRLGDAALEMSRRTAEKFADSLTAQDALAVALHKSGKTDGARALWRRLAEGGDKARVMSVARSASAREEHAFACDLLTARLQEFRTDALFLQQYCDAAQRVERYEEAVPWARALVLQARDAVELDSSLSLLIRLAGKAGKLEDIQAELKGTAQTPQEKCLLAELLDQSGDVKGAETLLREVESTAPELAVAVLVRLQMQRGDPAGAAGSMRRLVESPGGRKSVHIQRLVELYERAGKTKDALEWVPEWKKLSPGSNLPWQKEAALYFQTGNSREALRSLRQAVQEFDTNDDLKALLAEAFQEDGKQADAERLYTVLYENAKDMADRTRWAGKLAEVAKSAGKTTELIASFEERRRSNPSSLLPLLALAEIYRVAENYEGRRRMLMEAARLKENDLDLMLEIARVEESEEDYPRALETLKRAAALDKSGKVRQRIARLHFKSGNPEQGLAVLREISGGHFDPRQAEAIADSLCGEGQWKQAAEFLQPLLVKNPGDYRLHYLTAVALEEDARLDEAVQLFQRTLEIKEELPPPPGAPPSLKGTANEYTDSLQSLLPPEAFDLVMTSNTAWQAYYHRQNRGNALRQPVRTPGTVGMSRSMALCHLGKIASEADEATKNAALSVLQGAGVKATTVLMDLAVNGINGNGGMTFGGHLADAPDDETVLSLAAFMGGQRQNPQGDDVDFRMIREKLKSRRPGLSWMAGLRLASSDGTEDGAAFRETVNSLTALESPPAILLQTAVEALGGIDQRGLSIPEENRAAANALRAKLPGWYRRADPGNYQAQYAFMSIAAQLSNEEDLAPFVQLFEDEVAACAADPARNTRNVYFTRRSNTLLDPLTFPPRQLADYSKPVLGMLGGDSENYYGRRIVLEPDKVRAVLPLVKDPVLKVLLTAAAGEDEEVAALLPSMTGPPDATLNALLLHAAWLGSNDKYEEAAALLHRAQQAPMTKDIRRMVDSSLIQCAIEAGGNASLKEEMPLLTLSREAALRMRRDALSPAHRGELAGYMEELGLRTEAEQLTAGQAVVSAPAASFGLRGGRNASSGSTGRIDQLILKGKREEALKWLHRELKAHSKSWLTTNNSTRYQMREWRETVSRHGFQKELLEAARPSGDATGETLIQWGAAQDILGETTAALETYRKAIAQKPADPRLRQVYLTALLNEAPAKAAEELRTVEPALLTGLDQTVINIMSRVDSLEGRVSLIEYFADALSRFSPEDLEKADAGALLQAVETGVQTSWSNGDADSGSLYHTKTAPAKTEEEPEKPEMTALKQRRQSAHQKFTALLTRSTATARRAFEDHAGVALTGGIEDEGAAAARLDRMALEALTAEAKLRTRGPGQPNLRPSYTRQGEIQIRLPSPESWLLERAWKEQRPDRITGELIPLLKSLSSHALAKNIEEALPLYFCPDTDFPAVATAYLKKFARSAAPGTAPEQWLTALHVLELRKLDTDLTGAVIEHYRSTAGSNYGNNDFSHLILYALHLQKTKGPAAVRRLFSGIAEAALGPAEKRAEMIAKNYNPNSYTSGTPNAAIIYWIQFLRTAWNMEVLILPAAESYTREFLYYGREHVQEDQLFQYGNQLADTNFFRGNPEAVVKFFRDTPLTAGLTGFLSFSSATSRRCVAADIFQAMLNPEKAKLREAFAKEPRTFGTELIDTILEMDDLSAAVLTRTGARLEDIKKLEPAQREDIAGFIQVAVSRRPVAENKMTDAMRSAKKWAEETSMGGTEDRVEKILAIKTLRGAGNQYLDYQFLQSLPPVLSSLTPSKPDDAVKIFLKARTLVAGARKSGMNGNSTHGDNTSLMANTLSTALGSIPQRGGSDPAETRNLLSFVFRATLHPDGFPVEWKPEIFSSLGTSLVSLGTEPAKEASGPAGVFSVRRLLPQLAMVEGLQAGPLTGIARAAFSSAGKSMDEKDRKWLEEQAASGESREIAGALLAAVQLNAADAKRNGIDDPEKLPAAQKRLLALIQDDSLPVPVRLSIAGEFLAKPDAIESPVLCAAAALLAASWQQQLPLAERHSNNIVNAFVALHPDLSVEPPAAFRETSVRLISAWQRLPAGRARPGSYGYQFSAPDALSKNTAFVLALTVGDEAAMRQTLAGAAASAHRGWLVRLIKAKRFETAHMLLRVGGEPIYNDVPGSDENTWTPALAEAAKEFAATLSAPDEKFLAELLIASLRDSPAVLKGEWKGPAPLLADRLKEIATRIPEKFSDPLDQERAFAILNGDGSAGVLPDAALAAWAANQSFGTISVVENAPARQRRSALLTAHLKRRLAGGDLPAIRQAMSQIAGAAGAQRSASNIRDVARPLMAHWQSESAALMASTDPAVRRAVRDIWRELAFAKDLQNVLDSMSPGRAMRALLYDALDDAVAEYSTAGASVAESTRVRLVRELNAATVDTLESFKTPWPADEQAAAKLKSQTVIHMLQNTVGWPMETPGEPSTLRNLIDGKWLLPEDAFAAAPALMEKQVREGRTAQEFSLLYARAGRVEDALAALEKAGAAVPADNLLVCGRHALIRSQVMEILERPEEALAVLEAIPEEALTLKESAPGFRPQVLAARLRLELANAWTRGGASAVIGTAAKRLEAEPDSVVAREGAANAFALVAEKLSAAGDHTGAWHHRSAAFLITGKLAKSGNRKWKEALELSGKALSTTRAAAGAALAPYEAVPRDAVWRYREDTGDFAAWMKPDYDDSSWKSGPGPLGTGLTKVSFKTQTSIPPVMAFRTSFAVKDPAAVHGLSLELMRGDGAAVFLNGKEILRSNLKSGRLTPATRAENIVSEDDAVLWFPCRITPAQFGDLKKEGNVLSVILFQYNDSSTGLSFGLSMKINDLEAGDIGKTIDKEVMQKALGESWTRLPEAFRKTVLEE